jgi:hypothetical protein
MGLKYMEGWKKKGRGRVERRKEKMRQDEK